MSGHVHVHVHVHGHGHGHGHRHGVDSFGLVCLEPYARSHTHGACWNLLPGSVGSVKRVSPKPYSPRLSCEQVEANLAWVAESATVGPALWAEARAEAPN